MVARLNPQSVVTLCETCRFWEADQDLEEVVLGQCQARSSASAALRDVPGIRAGLSGRVWPLTENRDWCTSWRG
jgi:hypothetical protein